MTYHPDLLDPRDHIRLLVNDRSGDAATEVFPDATYDEKIELYGGEDVSSAGWKRAAADMAEAKASYLDEKRTGFAATGDVSLTWSADQAKTLRAKAIALRKEADAEDAAADEAVPIVSMYSVVVPGPCW